MNIQLPRKWGLKLEEKDRIAKYAAGLIQDEDFVYIDAGTTTGDILKFLKVQGQYLYQCSGTCPDTGRKRL